MQMRHPVALAALLLAACRTSDAPRPITATASAGEVALRLDTRAPVVVRVTSRHATPVAIYSLSEGVATRLGEVQGGRVEEFRMAAMMVPPGGLTLMAVPLSGDARASSGPLRVAPGGTVDFDIGATLSTAKATVR